jgi:hypothetical protein
MNTWAGLLFPLWLALISEGRENSHTKKNKTVAIKSDYSDTTNKTDTFIYTIIK